MDYCVMRYCWWHAVLQIGGDGCHKIIPKAKLYGMDQDARNTNRITSTQTTTGDTYLHSWFQNFAT